MTYTLEHLLNTMKGAVDAEALQRDKFENELVASGGILMALQVATKETALTSAEPVCRDGYVTNQIDVGFDFLKSKYRITVEKLDTPS